MTEATQANLPTVSSSKAIDKPRTVNPLGVEFERLKAHLPAEARKQFRMPLGHQRRLASAVEEAVAAAFMAGRPVKKSEELIAPNAKHADVIKGFMWDLYELIGSQGIQKVFLVLFNDSDNPAKPHLEWAVRNCHLYCTPPAKPLHKFEIAWVGTADKQA